MTRPIRCMRAALGAALFALAASPALAQSGGLGTISFPNSGDETAQKDFLDGVRLLHSFEWRTPPRRSSAPRRPIPTSRSPTGARR